MSADHAAADEEWEEVAADRNGASTVPASVIAAYAHMVLGAAAFQDEEEREHGVASILYSEFGDGMGLPSDVSRDDFRLFFPRLVQLVTTLDQPCHWAKLFYAEPGHATHVSLLSDPSKPVRILFLDVDGVLNSSEQADGSRSDCMSAVFQEAAKPTPVATAAAAAAKAAAPAAKHPLSCGFPLCTPQLTQLQRILRRTGCRVVLSTSWRQFGDMKRALLAVLRSMDGCPAGTVIGQTPDLSSRTGAPRAHEVYEFLLQLGGGDAALVRGRGGAPNREKHSRRKAQGSPASAGERGCRCAVGNWVVLDDMDLARQAAFLPHPAFPEDGVAKKAAGGKGKGSRAKGGSHSGGGAVPPRSLFAAHFVKTDMRTGLTQRDADRAIAILLGDGDGGGDRGARDGAQGSKGQDAGAGAAGGGGRGAGNTAGNAAVLAQLGQLAGVVEESCSDDSDSGVHFA
jgi:hypothetical protein